MFRGLSEHRWAVCMYVQSAEAAMESRDVVGVISPSEIYSRTLRDVIRESRGEGRVMEERKLKMRYSVLCFLRQPPFTQPLYTRPFPRCPTPHVARGKTLWQCRNCTRHGWVPFPCCTHYTLGNILYGRTASATSCGQ